MAYACQGGAPCCNQASCCAQGTCRIFSPPLFFLIADAQNRIEILNWTPKKYKKKHRKKSSSGGACSCCGRDAACCQGSRWRVIRKTRQDTTKFKRFMHVPPIYFKSQFVVRETKIWKIINPLDNLFALPVSDVNPSFSCEHLVEESTSCCRVDSRWTNLYVTEMFFYYYNLLRSSLHFLPLQYFR